MKKVIICAMVLVMAVVLSGCGEKAAEKAIETSSGGQVDVDIDSDKVTVNTNAGSLEVGEKVSLPSGFPTDVHIIDGTITSAMTLTAGESYTVSIQTTGTVNEAKADYENQLAADGWIVTMSLAVEDGFIMSAENGNRTVTVSIGDGDDGALVVLSTMTTVE